MKGGTSLRPDGNSRPSTWFLSVASSIDFCYLLLRPRPAVFRGL
jgi:hypothetical protein